MKKMVIALCLLACILGAYSAFALDPTPKVVVIPLISSKKIIQNGFDGSSQLTDSPTYIMSPTDVSLPVDGTCVVTATAYVGSLETTDTKGGPYFRTARQTGAGSPIRDPASGAYAHNIGVSNSTAVSATYAWDMTGGTIYRFGCGILSRPANWADDTGYCRVTWVCSRN